MYRFDFSLYAIVPTSMNIITIQPVHLLDSPCV
jgi:hypothetical protein